jgi:predicted nucleic-acid-binding protein
LNRILFDSDVILDVLTQRQPFFPASAQALDSVTQFQVIGLIAGHAVTNIYYILRRQLGNETSRNLLNQLLLNLQVASVTDAVIRVALTSAIADFEDAVSHAAALAAGATGIVTRNLDDFRQATIPVFSPEIFLTGLS